MDEYDRSDVVLPETEDDVFENAFETSSAAYTAVTTETVSFSLNYQKRLSNALPHLDLDKRKHGIKELITKTKSTIKSQRTIFHTKSVDAVYDIDDILNVYFSNSTQWVQYLILRINAGLPEDNALRDGEILGFFEVMFTCLFYAKSPTLLYGNAGLFKIPLMAFDRFMAILKSLRPRSHDSEDMSTWVDLPQTCPEVKMSLEAFSQLSQSMGFSSKYSVICLDDDKEHLSSKSVPQLTGCQISHQRGGKAGAQKVLVVDLISYVVLAARYVAVREGSNIAAKKAISSATTGMASNYDNLTLTGTSFSVDRQFNNKDMLEYVTSKQGFVSGTISHPKQAFASYASHVEMNKKLGEKKSANSPIVHMMAIGPAASYWVKYKSASHAVVYLLGYRQGNGSIVYLSTNDPALGPGRYIVEGCSDAYNDFQERYFEEAEGIPAVSEMLNTEGRCDRVTERQVDAVWFALRRFRVTSSGAAEVIGALIRSKLFRECENDRNHNLPIDELQLLQRLFHFRQPRENHADVLANEGAETADAPDIAEAAILTQPPELLVISEDTVVAANVAQLKAMCAQLNLKVGGNKLKVALQNLLLGHLETTEDEISGMNDQMRINKALLHSWNLNPSNTTQYMKEGKANERAVIMGLRDFIAENVASNTFSLVFIETTGLMVNTTNELLATSPDALAYFGKTGSASVDGAVVEVKTRLAGTTINDLNERVRIYGSFSECSADSDNFAEMIPVHRDRIQLLHHCAATELTDALYVESIRGGIIRCVHVVFTQEVVASYRSVMAYIASTHMDWVTNEAVDVPNFTEEELGFCPDMHTLLQQLHMWRGLKRLLPDGSYFKGTRKILPALIAYHNGTKSGADITTRELVNIHNPFHQLPIEAAMFMRTSKLALLNAYRQHMCMTMDGTIDDLTSTDAMQRHMHAMSFEQFTAQAMQAFPRLAILRGSYPLVALVNRNQLLAPAALSAISTHTSGKAVVATFSTEEGKQFRTSQSDHIPENTEQSRTCCYPNCAKRTKHFCPSCKVHLCVDFSDKMASCYHLWHRCDVLLPKPPIDAVGENRVPTNISSTAQTRTLNTPAGSKAAEKRAIDSSKTSNAKRSKMDDNDSDNDAYEYAKKRSESTKPPPLPRSSAPR